jgi:hypothetical protein
MAYRSAQLVLFDHRVRPGRLADTPHMRLYEELMRDPRGYIAAALSEKQPEEAEE